MGEEDSGDFIGRKSLAGKLAQLFWDFKDSVSLSLGEPGGWGACLFFLVSVVLLDPGLEDVSEQALMLDNLRPLPSRCTPFSVRPREEFRENNLYLRVIPNWPCFVSTLFCISALLLLIMGEYALLLKELARLFMLPLLVLLMPSTEAERFFLSRFLNHRKKPKNPERSFLSANGLWVAVYLPGVLIHFDKSLAVVDVLEELNFFP